MGEATHAREAEEKLWDLICTFQAAMLVTRAGGGQLSARPMSHIVRKDEHVVYILTEKTSETVKCLKTDPEALLTFADNRTYVSVSVRAAVLEDRQLIERLWNPGAQAFWPDGPGDRRVCAVALRPTSGEYWDGDNSLFAGVKLLAANLTGRTPDVGEHKEVRL